MYDNASITGIENTKSHDVPYRLQELLNCDPCLGLNIGAGNSKKPGFTLINSDYLLYENTDLAVDAHDLPFSDGVFDIVASFNAFEHFRDPARVSREIFRVLKPGGKLLIQAAFLQPLHMEPHHYYNATEYGIREWFSIFEIERAEVSANFTPLFNLSWIANIVAHAANSLSPLDRERLDSLTIKELASYWETINSGEQGIWTSELFKLSQRLPPSICRKIGGGFELEGRRPK